VATLSDQRPYEGLTPEVILGAVESTGLHADGSLLALNSYENRVYQVGIDEGTPVVAKFYRAGRWSDEAIREEHDFSLELEAGEIPVVAPLRVGGRTLHRHGGFRFALFPRRGGRWPELDSPDNLRWLGRFLARIHQVGAARPFRHRPGIDIERFALEPARHLLQAGVVPVEAENRYRQLTGELAARLAPLFEQAAAPKLRLHGDCHPGNILWTDQGPHFVDMDDCCNGPAVQDLWMLLSGDRNEMALQLGHLLEGYELFRPFDRGQLALVEPLRSLRIIHYAAWLARRWDDPAFPKAFPWFGTTQYWQEHLVHLEQQLRALDDPPLPAW